MHRTRLLSLVLALSVGSSSCWFQKPRTTRVFVPPPARPRPPLPDTVPEIDPGPEVDAKIAPEAPEGLPATLPSIPPPPVQPVKRPPTPAPKPVTTQNPPPPDTPAAPKLGQIYTADQLRDYNRNIDESLDRVKRVLSQVAGKNLSTEMNEIVGRIQTFQKQAEQARERDLVTAVNLARRADLLAQDLIKRLP